MILKKTLVSNNPMVNEKYYEGMDIIYSDAYTYLDVLLIARDKIHQGHHLLTHPLSGSVKPNETPYKTVAVTQEKRNLDYKSVLIMEESILTAKKFIENKKSPNWTEKLSQDFQLIDFYLIQNAVESMDQFDK
ncbi:MAG: GrdX family protein [Alkaliphilus sp.]|nr:GrdX family protein [Alkaliphilus sp.]